MKFKTVYGLDFSERSPVIVRAERAGRGIRQERVTEIPRGERVFVASSLATHEAFARWLAAPLASAEKARKVLPSLLDVQLPFPLEKCVYDFSEVSATSAQQSEALALAARVEDVQAALGRMNRAGFDPAILDHEALALWTQALEESPPHGNELRAILYAGADRSALVLGRGRRFLAAQGSRQSVPDSARIQQFLRVQLGEEANQPFTWAIVGPGAHDQIKEILNRPPDTPFLIYKEKATFLARALAHRALQKGPFRCNLRQGPAEHPQMALVRANEHLGAFQLCMAAAVALCIVNLAWMFFLGQRESRVQQELSGLAAELSGLPKVPKGQEVMIAERALEERTPRLAPFAEMFRPSTVEFLGSLLSASAKAGLRLNALSLKSESLALSGSAPNWAASDTLVPAIMQAGWTVNLNRGDVGVDERIPFTVEATR